MIAIGFIIGLAFAGYLGILVKRDAKRRYRNPSTARFWGFMTFGFAGFALPIYLIKRPPMSPEQAEKARKEAIPEYNR